MAEAKEDFACCPWAASDFLVKPEDASSSELPPIERILKVDGLESVDVLGVTEKELGLSMVERCSRLVELRRGLEVRGLTTPIHVFGAITPGSVVAYWLCGADIFDGLNWTRFAYGPGGSLEPMAEIHLDRRFVASPAPAVILEVVRGNLHELRRLELLLRRCADSDDLGGLSSYSSRVADAIEVARRVGALEIG